MNPLIGSLTEKRLSLESLLERDRAHVATLKASESRSLREVMGTTEKEIAALTERIVELQEAEVRDAAASKHVRETSTVQVLSEPEIYRPDATASDPSFFRDLHSAKQGDYNAAERLQRTHKVAMESRAGDMTSVAAAGGEWAPPAWLVQDFVALARAARVTADLCQKDTLPPGVSSVNLPKVASGATAAVQATQNSALSDTAMTTTSVSSGITTVGGKQIVSLQLIQQSGIPFDKVILGDLAAAYAVQVDNQVLYGSNASGQVRGIVGVANNNAFTTASPALTSATAANSFYNKIIAASAAINTTRFLPADAIVMHPNRWAWCLEALDSQVRPIITADGGPVNTVAISTDVRAQGSVGTMAKIPVYIDPNISLTANSATNQDEVYLLRSADLYLWETAPLMQSFEATYADNASVLFRVLGYMAFICNRYSASSQSIRGTGLIAPVL